MCGIHGFFTGKTRVQDASDYISDSFVAGSLRGMDSSGIAVISTKEDKIEHSKLPVCGSIFITDKFTKSLIEQSRGEGTITICHTRAATQGGVGYSQAHPFYMDDVEGNMYREMIGVHNGTLYGWKTHADASKFDVDSEWALNHIFKNGAKAFEDFTGAYCFVWWDSVEEDTLNFALNDQRPMHIALLENGSLAYASEPGMLNWILERNKMKIKGNILKLMPDYWYKFVAGDLEKYTKKLLPKKPVAVSTYNAGSYGGGPHNRAYDYRSTVMDKVDAIFERIRKENADATPQTNALVLVSNDSNPTSTAYVSREEVENAQALQMQGDRGTFIPSYFRQEKGELYGSFTSNGSEIEGVMRNAAGLNWHAAEQMDCSIIGIIDDGKNLLAVLSKPRIRLTSLAA